MTLLKNQCELERTQLLTILMLAMQNTRHACYMLTGNSSVSGYRWKCCLVVSLSQFLVTSKCLVNVMIGFRTCVIGIMKL